MRFLPRSLFGRSLLVLAAGLLTAQFASVALNLVDRGSSVYRLASYQIAARIAQTARILNRLPPQEREVIAKEIDGQHLRVALHPKTVDVGVGFEEHDAYEKAFVGAVMRQIGAPWPVRVEISTNPRDRRASLEGAPASAFEVWVARNFFYLLPSTFSLVAQVGLEDGSVAVFYAAIPHEPLNRLESLVPRLLLLLTVCFALATMLVFMVNRPLQRLAQAADSIGDDPGSPPVAESGPSEIRSVIAAFNRMQERVRRHVHERTQMLGAIPHDLKTPITRLRLRSEMLDDDDLRGKIQRDLDEMESMVRGTLEFFSDLGDRPQRVPVDIEALVGSLCEDRRESGQAVELSGSAREPYRGYPQSLKRCIDNLVGNAVRYGGSAHIAIEDSHDTLRIIVTDKGPGIPDAELERVFEPYFRLEDSRNIESGGTGLGLSIARNIARWHGGDVFLRNAPGGGLIAELVLGRDTPAAG